MNIDINTQQTDENMISTSQYNCAKVQNEDNSSNARVGNSNVSLKQNNSLQSAHNKPLTPYQKYKQSKNQNGKKYFEFYDDIKVYTHNIYDW